MGTIAETSVSSRRTLEAVLFVLAVGLSIAACALVSMGAAGSLTSEFWLFSATITLLGGVLHGALRAWAPAADPIIAPLALALNGIGLAMIYRIDLGSTTRPEEGVATSQLLWTAVGMVSVLVVLATLRDHRQLRRMTFTAMTLGIGLLALPLVPLIGTERNGSRVWIEVWGYSAQPAEFAKIAVAVFFAGYLVAHREVLALAGPKFLGLRFPRIRDAGPLVLAWGVSLAILVFQRDLGTSLIFFGMFIAMLYVATQRASWVVMGLGLFLGGAFAASAVFPHVAARYETWLFAFSGEIYDRNPGGSGQLVQGIFGLSTGGLWGTGLGEGQPWLVPFAESDFIFAALGEELGLAGVMAILTIYLIIGQRAMRTALGVRDGFGKLLAAGIGFTLILQVCVVVGGVTRLIPLTGMTAPLLAAGGSSLVATWIMMGVLLRISDSAHRAERGTS